MSVQADVVVIGAGPAGLAAALRCAEGGLGVQLLDAHTEPGGPVWRGLERDRAGVAGDYPQASGMLDRLTRSAVTHHPGATVWEVTRRRQVTYAVAGRARQVTARRVILACGALERPMPFPGWTLPGVMTVGAAQIMLKTAGLVPPGSIVLAGSGPLVDLVALQLTQFGRPPDAILDTAPLENRLRALGHLPTGAEGRTKLRAGLATRRALRRAGVPRTTGVTALKALGDGRVTQVRAQTAKGEVELPCTTLLTHLGLLPDTQISRALNLGHSWDAERLCFRPDLDEMGRSDLSGVLVAGDGAGIAGAEAAMLSGELAALAVLEDLLPGAATEHATEVARLKDAQARETALVPFLSRLFRPAEGFLDPADDTIVCRCEEVTAGAVRALVARGVTDPNAVKSQGRAGMGACQGRYCGTTVSQIVARALDRDVNAVGQFRLRTPITPVTLSDLAALDLGEDADG